MGSTSPFRARNGRRCWQCWRFAHGRVVAVDDLIDALWGADLPAAPRNAVQHHIARLRAGLGHGTVAGSGEGYALRHATVDAIVFEELLAAAQRHGAPATHARRRRTLQRHSRSGAALRSRA